MIDDKSGWLQFEDSNEFGEYKRLIVHELRSLHSENNEIKKEVKTVNTNFNDFKVEMAKELTSLKVKAGIWGMLSASVPTTIGVVVVLLDKYLKPDDTSAGIERILNFACMLIEALTT